MAAEGSVHRGVLTVGWRRAAAWLFAALLMLPVVASAGPAVESWHTSRGAKVMYVHAPELPMLDVRVVFDAGSARDGERPGLARFVNSMLSEGAGDWAAMQTIMARYQADGVLVVDAADGEAGMDLSVDWYEGPQPREIEVAGLAPDARTPEERFDEAVAQVRQAVDAQWTAASTVPQGPEETLIAEIVG